MSLSIDYLLLTLAIIGALNLIAAIALITRKNIAVDPTILAQLNRLENAQTLEARAARAEQTENLDRFAERIAKTINALGEFQKERLDLFAAAQENLRKISEENLKDIRAAI